MSDPEMIAEAVGESVLDYVKRQEGGRIHALLLATVTPLLTALKTENAPAALQAAANRVAAKGPDGSWYPIGNSTAHVIKVFSRCVKAGYAPSPATLAGMKRLIKAAKYSGKLVATAAKHAEERRHKGFWNELRDGVVAVADNPIFKGALTIATSCIPGVGAVLAPIALAVETGVTNMVKDAAEGKPAAADALNMVSKVASSALSAVPAASPAIGAAIQAGETTAKQVWDTANESAAYVRALAQPPSLISGLRAARQLVLRAKAGDPAAIVRLRVIAANAKGGDKGAIQSFGYVTSVIQGIANGHIPGLKDHEIHKLNLVGVRWKKAATHAASAPLTKIRHLDRYEHNAPADDMGDMGDMGDEPVSDESVETNDGQYVDAEAAETGASIYGQLRPPAHKKTPAMKPIVRVPMASHAQTAPSKASRIKLGKLHPLTHVPMSHAAQSSSPSSDSSTPSTSVSPTNQTPMGGNGGGGGGNDMGMGMSEEQEEDFEDTEDGDEGDEEDTDTDGDDDADTEDESSGDEVIGARKRLSSRAVLAALRRFRQKYHSHAGVRFDLHGKTLRLR